MTQDILITPKSGEPQIKFNSSGPVSPVNLNVISGASPVPSIAAAGSGVTSVVFDGTQGRLLEINDNLSSGTIFHVSDSAGFPFFEINASGDVKLAEYGRDVLSSGLVVVATGMEIQRNTPSVTTDKLYNIGGNLYFNGTAVGAGSATITGSGTANYVPRFSGVTSIATGLIFDNGTSVGISTSSPDSNFLLDVRGKQTINTNSSQAFVVANASSNDVLRVNTAGTTAAKLQILNEPNQTDPHWITCTSFGGSAGDVFIVTSSGDVGINNKDPEGQIHVVNNLSTDVGLIVEGAASQSEDLQQWQNSAGTVMTSISANGNIDTTGNVSVSGDVNLTGNLELGGYINDASLVQFRISNSPKMQIQSSNVELRGPFLRFAASDGTDKVTLSYVDTDILAVKSNDNSALAAIYGATGQFSASLISSGTIESTGLVTAATGIALQRNTPSSTTDKLYNVGGSLYFNGSAVGGGGGGGISFSGSTANGLVTFGDSSTANVESNLTFDGSSLNVSGLIIASTGITLQRNTPATTTDKLYNVGGGLYFNGSGYPTTTYLNTVSGNLDSRVQTNAVIVGLLQNQITSNDADISALQAATGLLNPDVSDLKTATGLLNTDVSALKTATGLLNTDVSALETATGVLNTNVSALQTATGLLNTDVSALETATGNLDTRVTANAAASGYLQSQITSNDTDISALQTSTGLLNTKTTALSGVVYNGSPSGVAFFGSNGALTANSGSLSFNSGTNSLIIKNGDLSVTPASSTTVPITVQAAASQSANMAEFKRSDGKVLTSIAADGSIATSGNISSTGDITGNGGATIAGSLGIGTGNHGSYKVNVNTTSADHTFVINDSNGRVGINTETLSSDLNIGGARQLKFTGGNSFIDCDSGSHMYLRAGGTTFIQTDGAGIRFFGFDGGAQLNMRTAATGRRTLVIEKLTSQTADLLNVRDENDDPYFVIDADGNVDATGLVTAHSGIALDRITPVSTTDKLYNVGGSLYFNGSAVGGGSSYTAGSGLTLDGTEFNIFGGTGNFRQIDVTSTTKVTPKIVFTGSGVNDTPINLEVLSSFASASTSGTALSFEGTQGQLFSITDNLSSGTIFSVNDITGLSLIDVDASGDVSIGKNARYVSVGTGVADFDFEVFASGKFHHGVTLENKTPSTTTDTLYNDGASVAPVKYNGSGIPFTDPETSASGVKNMMVMTEAVYTALSSKDANTLYFLV